MSSCDCIKSIDKDLEEYNGRLGLTLGFGKNAGPYPTIEIEKINKRGKRPPLVIPSFCPFCGEKYRTKDGSDE